MSDSPDGKSNTAGARQIPAAPGVPRTISKPPPPPGAVVHRPTTRMTADEIAAAIEDAARSRTGDELDSENTPVLDPVEDAADDAPTADYDPRARMVHRAASVGTPPPPAASSEGVRADGSKRRTSRRTVKIPDDAVNRPHPSPAPPDTPVAKSPTSEPPTVRRPSEPPMMARPLPQAQPAANEPPRAPLAQPEPDAANGAQDETFVLRPMRIISIGSDPPPPITSAVADWPSAAQRAPSTPPPPAEAAADRKSIDSLTKTDMLPPAIPEDGWTPAPALVAPPVPRFAPGARPAPADDEIEVEVDADSADTQAEDQDLLEDIEPDSAPAPAKKPPPPPSREARAKPAEAAPPSAPATEPGAAAEKAKPKPWFEDIFSEDYSKTIDVLAPEHVKKEVDFIEESLGIERDGMILDLACGRGEHAIELARRGYNVVGVDLSPVALAAAHENLKRSLAKRAKESGPDAPQNKPSFLRADMRALDFEENFDGAYCWATSLGYFDDETNVLVLKRLHRALRQGGMLLIDVVNRDFVAPRSPSLVWFEGEGAVCMDDMSVDFLTSRLRVKRTAMFEDGHSRELEYSIRLYSLDALGRILRDVGFRVVEATGHIAHPGIFFGSESPRLIVLAERI